MIQDPQRSPLIIFSERSGEALKPVKNEDLWRQLDEISGNHEVRWHWVKGHSGHSENERADQLASLAIDELSGGADA